MDICVFQWAPAALIGLHVTTSFMAMLLNYKATQCEHLENLPKLHEEFRNYHTSMIKSDGPVITALKNF